MDPLLVQYNYNGTIGHMLHEVLHFCYTLLCLPHIYFHSDVSAFECPSYTA